MKLGIRSSTLPLLASGLLVISTAACSDLDDAAAELRSSESESTAESSDGVTETLSGEVEFLSPGEYIIDGQAFLVGEDTEILGGIYACADGTPPDDGSGTVPCDIDTFENALQSDMDVHATVEVNDDGIAGTIVEELV